MRFFPELLQTTAETPFVSGPSLVPTKVCHTIHIPDLYRLLGGRAIRVQSFGFNFVFLVFKTRTCFYNGEISSYNRSVLEVFMFCAWFNFVSDI